MARECEQEMNDWRWSAFAIGYMCVFAYAVSFVTYQLGSLFLGTGTVLGTVLAVLVLALFIYLLVRPDPNKAKK